MLDELVAVMRSIGNWVNNGSREMLGKTSERLAAKYRQQIFNGLNADGSPMAPLADTTINGPVRREGNRTIRNRYGISPLDATGRTLNSIHAKKVNSDEYEISSDTQEGDMILASNARGGFNIQPFYGDVKKPIRDPLQASDPQLDFVENEIVKDLERTLGI